MLSVTYGNVEVENCLKNVVAMFYHIEKELAWRQERGLPLGFDSLRETKPIVAAGPAHPLMEEMLMADYFRGLLRTSGTAYLTDHPPDGRDGLGDISTSVCS